MSGDDGALGLQLTQPAYNWYYVPLTLTLTLTPTLILTLTLTLTLALTLTLTLARLSRPAAYSPPARTAGARARSSSRCAARCGSSC